MIEVTAQAFLFDANAEGVSAFYGSEFDPAFLKALAETDSTALICSRVLRGDALVETLCRHVKNVSNTPHGQSSVYGYNMELYRTLIWDMADAFAGQWNTLDLESFPLVLARSNVHCIVLPTFPVSIREVVDQKLRPTRGYLGSLELDVQSPIQSTIFIDYLIHDAFIVNGIIHLERDWDGADNSSFVGSRDFAPGGELRLASDAFHEQEPRMPLVSGLSERGLQSLERYEGKKTYTIEDRVIHALSQLEDPKRVPFSFASSSRPTDVLEADMPEAKFILYLLNPEHKDGRGKAKFFSDVLSIEAKDWRYLAAQFYEGLKQTKFSDLGIKVWADGFGASFNCVLPVKGLNNRVVKVFTNWIMRPGFLPQLATARPEEAGVYEDPLLPALNIVPAEVRGTVRWEQLYNLAHKAGEIASEQCVPTPMKVTGYPVEMDGLCGFASIHIPDARKDFARWVVRSNVGSRHYKGGAIIFAHRRTQSIDKAKAYAKAFASVLKLNGVQCTTDSRLD